MSAGIAVLNICNSFIFCIFPLSAKALKLESPEEFGKKAYSQSSNPCDLFGSGGVFKKHFIGI